MPVSIRHVQRHRCHLGQRQKLSIIKVNNFSRPTTFILVFFYLRPFEKFEF
jgi:hypothetical protein